MNINPTSFIEIHQQVRGVGDKYWIQNKGNKRTGR